jgi:hypothetical protein
VAGQLIPVRVGEIEVLVETMPVAGTQPTSVLGKRSSEVVDQMGNAFDRAQTAILNIATSTAQVMEKAARTAVHPETLAVEFGLKFSAQGDIIVAGAAAEASLKVTLTFAHPQGAGR